MKTNVVNLNGYRPRNQRPIDPWALMFYASVGVSIGIWYGAWRAVCPFI